MSRILITGGAGYIGSHTARQFIDAGHQITVVDNLYSGHRWAVPESAHFVEMNIADTRALRSLIVGQGIEAIVHFAGHIVVPESVSDPAKYYTNNSRYSQRLVQTAIECEVPRFIFSSTAAVYGMPKTLPVREDAVLEPINPYGTSKLITEWVLADAASAHPGFRYCALRYFNVAGARADGTLGQATPEATHLIKVACESATGTRTGLTVFGNDYDTPDGTCIRDYIHVDDLASAHLAALGYMENDQPPAVFNCGYGRGFSVREILINVEKVSGKKLNVADGPRRPGDPAALIADSSRLRAATGWTPKYNDIEIICESAYRWELKLNQSSTVTPLQSVKHDDPFC